MPNRSPFGPPEPVVNGFDFGPDPKANILLVDDRPDKLLALEAVVQELGQNIVTARSGKEALKQLLLTDFAVILLDVSMPGLDGFETAALIRSRDRSEHTPIIFVTSVNQSDNYIRQGYALGAVDYVLSPIVPQILKTKVAVFVELFRKTEQIRRHAELLRAFEEAAHRRDLAEAADRLDTETKRNRFFVLSIDLLAIASFKGAFLQLNPSWRGTLGLSEEELKSGSALDLVHEEDREPMQRWWSEVTDSSGPGYYEARFRCSGGGYRWLGWTAAAFPAEQLVYVFARDVTARKKAQQEIEDLNAKLKHKVAELTQSNQGLEAFSYSISHDLRAPLRAMQCFAQALEEEHGPQLGDGGRKYTERIINSSRYMDNLLRDLLEYSRVSRAELKMQATDLDTCVRDAMGHLDKEISDHQAAVKVDHPLGVIRGHGATTRQLLINLLANAIKFTPAGATPQVRIWAEHTDEPEATIKLWVEDNGIGIAPDHHERIFGLFERLHAAEAYPGTGVGLALVRKGVERMGGRVGLFSELGTGSRFWIQLAKAPQ